MIKQTITYDDYDDNSVTEDFYFNLTKLEIMEMEINFEGGLNAHIAKLTKADSGPEAYHLFKDIILSSYGKKSEDGKRFIKSDELKKEFEQSPALGELIFGFLQHGQDAAKFTRGILPAKLIAEVEAEAAKAKATETTELPTAAPQLAGDEKGVLDKEFEDYTKEELLDMSQEQFQKLVPSKPNEMSKEQLQIAMQRKN
jgi:hypothetical protein